LILNGIHQLPANADDVNILGGSVQTIKKNAEALVVATREIGLEVNAEKPKYMVMARDQNAGRNHNMKIDNSSIERVEEFKYLGKTLTNQNSIQVEIKSRLKLGNPCYYSIQNLLSSRLLSKNWGDPDVDWRIILRGIFRKWEGVVGTGWSGLRIGTDGGHL
jgi:hypothetical protein